MPIKSLLHRFQPAPLYIILVLSICYFSVQLVLSHITHALTLLFSSYHMLCNIFALAGCIVTMKQSNHKSENGQSSTDICCRLYGTENHCVVTNNDSKKSKEESSKNQSKESTTGNGETCKAAAKLSKCEQRELKLRNTFGWARIDILAMLIVCIILASLSFSLLVEALQTLVHISHQDTMHLPIPVMILGFVGLLLNGLTYLMIGGYTMHQGSFLQVTPTGNVILDRTMSNSADLALQPEERQLSAAKLAREQRAQDKQLKQQLQAEGIKTTDVVTSKDNEKSGGSIRRQGAAEMLRDVSSTLFVIVCGFIVYMAEDEQHTAKFIDPVLSIFSCVLLVSLSYRYMKESCLVLLQTIPDGIDMQNFESTLVKRFPQIVSFHDLHIWQLTPQKCVATVHIQFENPKLYLLAIEDVRSYFHDSGINEVTIQPEFYSGKPPSVSSASVTPSMECLMQCNAPECADKMCCKDSRNDLREVVSVCPNASEKLEREPAPLIAAIQMPKIIIQTTTTPTTTTSTTNSKTNFIKKLLPRFEVGVGAIERSKSTNDLTKHKQQQLEQQTAKKAQNSQALKKTVSESNMEQQQGTFVDMLQTRIETESKKEFNSNNAAPSSAALNRLRIDPQI